MFYREASVKGTSAVCNLCTNDKKVEEEAILQAITDHAMQRELNNLIVQCPFKDCSDEMKLNNFKDHAESCVFKPLPCPNQCGKEYSNEDMQDHLKNHCKMRELACGKCGKYILAERINNHLSEECESLLEQCNYCGLRYHIHKRSAHPMLCSVPWTRDCPYDCTEFKAQEDDKLLEHRNSSFLNHLDRVLAMIKDIRSQLDTMSSSIDIIGKQNQQFESLFDNEGLGELNIGDRMPPEALKRVNAMAASAPQTSVSVEDSLRPIKGKIQEFENILSESLRPFDNSFVIIGF